MGLHREDCSVEARGVSHSIRTLFQSRANANFIQQKPSRRSNCLFPCPLNDRHCRPTTIPKRNPVRRDRRQCVDTSPPKNRYCRESELVKEHPGQKLGRCRYMQDFRISVLLLSDVWPPCLGWLLALRIPIVYSYIIRINVGLTLVF